MSDPFQNRPTSHNGSTDGSAVDAAKDTAALAKDTASAAKDAAAGVAGTGKQAAAEVAQTGLSAASDVAQQTKKQATDLLGKTRDQLSEQVQTQQASIVDTLRTLGDQLASMTQNTDEQGTAVDIASQARDRARSAADWLDNRGPDEVLDELRNLGRRRPGAFLLGAAVAGVVAGRLTRGVVEEHTGDNGDSSADGQPSSSYATPAGLPASDPSPRPYEAAPLGNRPAPGRHEIPTTPATPVVPTTPATSGWATP